MEVGEKFSNTTKRNNIKKRKKKRLWWKSINLESVKSHEHDRASNINMVDFD